MADKTHPSSNALMAFDSEGGAEEAAVQAPTAAPAGLLDATEPEEETGKGRTVGRWIAWFGVAFLAIIGIAATTSLVALGPMRLQVPGVRQEPATGRVTFETVPVGVEVLVDGESRGTTPLTFKLAPGHHEAMLRRGTEEHQVPFELTAGGDLVHHVEFAAPSPTLSRLSVVSEPSGARVSVDGEVRGISPLTVSDLAPGRHRIVVTGAGATSDRMVTTEAGSTTSVVFSLGSGIAPDAGAGWLGIDAPFEVRAIENGEVIGTSAAAKIMMRPGGHDIDFINTTLGYQSRRRVDVVGGRTATVKIDARAPVNINANPWAEVTIDGNAMGLTPIANLALALGHHRVIFRHNEFGEQRQDIVVTVPGPNQFSADLTR